MQKGPIYISISRVLAGDNSALDKLCRQLADRTVFVPTKESAEGLVTRTPTPVQVMRIVDSKGRSMVPVFLQQSSLAEWCQNEGLTENSISLLGADVCVAMDQSSWIILEPSTENELKLEPKIVEIISKVGQDPDLEQVGDRIQESVQPQITRVAAPDHNLSSKLKREVVSAEKSTAMITPPPKKAKGGLMGFIKGLRAH